MSPTAIAIPTSKISDQDLLDLADWIPSHGSAGMGWRSQPVEAFPPLGGGAGEEYEVACSWSVSARRGIVVEERRAGRRVAPVGLGVVVKRRSGRRGKGLGVIAE